MKKIYSLVMALVVFASFATAQCTVNASAQTTPGVNPEADQLPCVEVGVAYDQTIQGQIQASKDTTILSFNATIRVDSLRFDSIVGLPTGINWAKSPNILLGGGNGCVRFFGTTTVATGTYDLAAFGTVWLRVLAPGTPLGDIDTPYVYTGNLNQFSPFGNYYLNVITPGAACNTTSIKNFSADLNAALSVYPNPSNGNFELKLNAGRRVNGEIVVTDVTGARVFTQTLDVMGMYNTSINLSNFAKGLYTVQIRTAEGFASKSISIQ